MKTGSQAKGSVRDQRAILEERLNERFAEIAELTRLLAETQLENQRLKNRIEWIHQVAPLLREGGFKLKFLNRRQNAALLARLKSNGLFDPDAYLAANPDVAQAGADPLRHYLTHGLSEGRSRG